jgi:hypothetical protein
VTENVAASTVVEEERRGGQMSREETTRGGAEEAPRTNVWTQSIDVRELYSDLSCDRTTMFIALPK